MAVDNPDTTLPLLESEGEEAQGDAGYANPSESQPSEANAGEDAAGQAAQPAQTVPLERFQEVERQVQRYRELGLSGLADELEQDPTKIHDIRAAIAGGYQQPRQQQYQPPQQPQQSPEQVAQMNDKLRNLMAEDPIQAMAMMQQAVVKTVQDQMVLPIKKMTGRQAVEMFKSRMARDVPEHYPAAAPYFDKLIARTDISQIDSDNPDIFLESLFKMAVGEAYQASYAKAKAKGKIGVRKQEPPNMGSGGAPASGGKLTPKLDKDVEDFFGDVAKWAGLTKEEYDALKVE